ncbi:MAG: hypothetical protein E6H09_23745 [Bacteroidetes bacterium]|nr:MAG: hypothetical protein E6H09_23745 [Bacteroidota bacterium]
MTMKLQRTVQIPKDLEPGVLYLSEEFEFTAHLCACGCGSKIRIPLGPTEWEFTDTKGGPTLFPSVGNWQQKCQSHYFITRGEIRWMAKWSPEEIAEGRRQEEARRQSYYDELYREQNLLKRVWNWLKGLFSS